MKKLTKTIAGLMIAGIFIGAPANIAVTKAVTLTSDKTKVHLTAKVTGKVGVTEAELAEAFEEMFAEEPNIEFVEEKGKDVEEITVVIQLDDGDADDDGTPDAKDADANGDGIPDDQQQIAAVDLDKDKKLLDEVHDSKPDQGLNILIQANDAKHHILKFHTNADPPTETAQGFKLNKTVMMNSFAPASSRKVPKWLKTTFTVVSYTARFASCATGSLGTCVGLLVEGYAK